MMTEESIQTDAERRIRASEANLADLRKHHGGRRWPTLNIPNERFARLTPARSTMFSPTGSPAAMCAG